jgi:prolipoprotein diacylglyceryltransferase
MYPTLRDILYDFTGLDIPIFQIVQTYGMMVATAFIVSAFFLMKELQRKEKDGLLSPLKKKVLKGKPASVRELITSGILGFVLGFKLIGVVLNYDVFFANPQSYILSTQGSFIGGILFALASSYLRYREKQKDKLDEPELVEETIRPHEHISNIVVISAGHKHSLFIAADVIMELSLTASLGGGGDAVQDGS